MKNTIFTNPSKYTAIALLSLMLTFFDTLTAASSHHKNNFDDLWFKGSVEEAFNVAKKTNKPVFIYWGAIWCPPCNQLKRQVFSKEKFRNLVKSVIPIYLDGDHDSAQFWGDRFNASGYPTILLLTKDKVEVMRITSSVNIDEFEVAFKSGLASLKPFRSSLDLALNGEATRSDWERISYSAYWEKIVGENWQPGEILEKMSKLQNLVPDKYRTEKVLLTANLLSNLYSVDDKSDKEVQKISNSIKSRASNLVGVLLENEKTIFSARSTIAYETGDILGWLKKNTSSADYTNLKAKWLKAADLIKASSQASIEIRFWASLARLFVFQSENPENKKLPSGIKKEAIASANWAVSRAKNNYYDRHSVISGAAWLLSEVEEYEAARKVLVEELKSTDTPWYYQSSLASVERKSGNEQLSLKYYKAARLSSKGGATRLQWITADLKWTTKLMPKPDKNNRVNEILNDFYKTSFKLRDGFAGRNKKNLKRVETSMKKIKTTPNILASIHKYSKFCLELLGDTKKDCNAHFNNLLNPTTPKGD